MLFFLSFSNRSYLESKGLTFNDKNIERLDHILQAKKKCKNYVIFIVAI